MVINLDRNQIQGTPTGAHVASGGSTATSTTATVVIAVM